MLESKQLIRDILEKIAIFRSIRNYGDQRIAEVMDNADYEHNIKLKIWKLYYQYYDKSGQLKPQKSEEMFQNILQAYASSDNPEFRFLSDEESEKIDAIYDELEQKEAELSDRSFRQLITGEPDATWEDTTIQYAVMTHEVVQKHFKSGKYEERIRNFYNKLDYYLEAKWVKPQWFLNDLLVDINALNDDLELYRQAQQLLDVNDHLQKRIRIRTLEFINYISLQVQHFCRLRMGYIALMKVKDEYKREFLKDLVFDFNFPIDKIELATQIMTQDEVDGKKIAFLNQFRQENKKLNN